MVLSVGPGLPKYGERIGLWAKPRGRAREDAHWTKVHRFIQKGREGRRHCRRISLSGGLRSGSIE